MSDDYSKQIEQIRRAQSLEEIQAVARQYPAKAIGEGGILYSRPVGEVSSETIAKELASKTGEPIINNTPRAQFLGDKQVETAIHDAAERLFKGQGQGLEQAGKSAGDFLYGNPKAVARSATSLEGSLWGEASHEFAGSLRGDIKVVATNANIERVFGKVELPVVLENPNVRTLGGQPVSELKALYAQGGADAVLPKVQAQFIEAVPKGIFVSPDNVGPKVTKVSLSQEVAATLGADAAKFPPAAELANAGLTRAPTGFGAPAASLGEAAITGEAVAASKGLRPGMLAKGGTVIAVAALAYDFSTTGHQVVKLEAQGNATGAESAKTHFIGRNVGGIGGGIAVGFLAGAGYGLAGGSPSGPGALVTSAIGGVAGGVGGAFLGEKWAQQKDIDSVFTQKDRDGNEWSRDPNDPKGTWSRVAETQKIKATTTASPESGSATYSKVRYVAGDVLANQLNYKSANASYELGLANLSQPQNPYSIPSGKGETPSLDGEGHWNRNPQTHTWSRTVVDQYIEHGMKVTHAETATPQRAAELDQASKLIIAQNAANTPAAIAGRYEVAYNQFGWHQHGDMPAAVKHASAQTDSLQASDGHTYTRGANGEWATPGMIYGTNQAQGNVRDELNEVHRSQQAGLQEYAAMAAEAQANPTLPKATTMRGMVAGAYANAGIARTEAEIDAATAAVSRTHAHDGLDAGKPYSLMLQPDPKTGRPGPNSAIVTMMDDGRDGFLSDSKMVPKAITTAEDIKQAEKPALEGKGPAIQSGTKPPESPPHASLPAHGSPTSAAIEHTDKQASPLGQLPPNDQALFAKLRDGAPPHIADDHVAHAMLLSKKEGMTDAGKIDGVRLAGDTLWVTGTTPGFRASVNTNEPVPSLQETSQQSLAFNKHQEQQLAQEATQRNQDVPGRGGPAV
ncbi:hypothetical protein HEP73_01239 [Xanthomonas sp. GW]|uniref:hypothetical protein n=1 Tax=Xanthomonas sp. GW TaxID=2724121 RepID=UPI00163AAAFB|nr:hypothetical protein [Xanthomonas sp. GW]QNH20339.1 hypothetical protein HEP73_01239 [Xanthomonas sp. GW]